MLGNVSEEEDKFDAAPQPAAASLGTLFVLIFLFFNFLLLLDPSLVQAKVQQPGQEAAPNGGPSGAGDLISRSG